MTITTGKRIKISRDNLRDIYACILENEKRGYEQVGDIGDWRDMNGAVRYVAVMRKVYDE